MKVKCIDNSELKDCLEVGKIYEVEATINWEGSPYYNLKGVTPKGFRLERFEVVSEGGECFPSEKTIRQVSKIQNDAEEEACWRAMQPRLSSPDNCKCDMLRSKCPYHKD